MVLTLNFILLLHEILLGKATSHFDIFRGRCTVRLVKTEPPLTLFAVRWAWCQGERKNFARHPPWFREYPSR